MLWTKNNNFKGPPMPDNSLLHLFVLIEIENNHIHDIYHQLLKD